MFCIGHSHTACIVEAARTRGEDLDFINLWGFGRFGRPVIYEDGVPQLHPMLVERLHGPVFSTLGGSAHDVLGLVQHPRPFDLILPEAPDLPLVPGSDILPGAALRQVMEGMMRETLDLLTALVKTSTEPVYQIESPPPSADGERLSQLLADVLETPVGGAFLHPGSQVTPDADSGRYKVSDKYLRYKLWRLNSQMFRETCEAAGAVFVPHPPQSVDAEGFLKPELLAFAGHANEIYGAMVLEQINALAAAASTPAG
jgi:hypothetical protein